jgi:hypothetical protein
MFCCKSQKAIDIATQTVDEPKSPKRPWSPKLREFKSPEHHPKLLEETLLHRRINKLLGPHFEWDKLDPVEICKINTQILSSNTLELAWKNWRHGKSDGKQVQSKKQATSVVNMWHPGMLKDVERRTYELYFPAIVNQSNGDFVAYNPNLKAWFGMPQLNFLPNNVKDVIAGDGGLLCVNGGVQPRLTNPGTPPIPYANNYNLNLYPQQSILLVCNPLTQEIKFIPRHTNKTLDGKIAWMQITVPTQTSLPDSNISTHAQPARNRYRLHVVGTHHQPATLNQSAQDELVLMTYDSRADAWISGTVVGHARLSKSVKPSLAVLPDGFFLGGQEETNEVIRVRTDKCRKKDDGEFQEGIVVENVPQDTLWRYKECKLWANKIFFVQSSTLRWHSVDFEVLGVDDLPREDMQVPRLLQCKPGDPVFAVTRSTKKSDTIEVYEVMVMDGGFPTGCFKLQSKMPKGMFQTLFQSETSLKEYFCSASLQTLCFWVPGFDEIGQVGTIVMYNVVSNKWSKSQFPYLSNTHIGLDTFSLTRCSWTPDWRARP